MNPVIELRRHFDANAWQVASNHAPSGSTLLVTWTVEPEPVDAGIPPSIQPVLADALCSVGPCWFAGDEESTTPVATVRLRRGLLWHKTPIFRADRDHGTDLLPAFATGAHDWTMAAQWIVVGARSGAPDIRAADILRALLESWELPRDWPPEASLIIQAGVDGDAAACHCRTREIEQELRGSLQRCAAAHGVAFRSINA